MFDNPYTSPGRLNRRVMGSPSGQRPFALRGRGGPPRARGAVSCVLALGVAGLLLALTANSGALSPGGSPALVGFTSYDSGRLHVVFPSALPGVELFQDQNSAVGAALFVDYVLELAPGNSEHPTVTQVATPTASTPFSATTPTSGAGSFGLALRGSMPVFRPSVPLWSTPEGLPANVSQPTLLPVVGGASLTVSYQLLPAGSQAQGLSLSFNIRDWPWLSIHDLLGVEVRFVVFNATAFDACPEAPQVANSSGSACASGPLGLGSIQWDPPGVDGVVGQDPSGFAAAFAWSASANVSGMSAVTVTPAAYHALANTTRISLVTPAAGASNVTTTGQLFLAAPGLPSLVLVGDPLAYAGGSALFAVLASVGLLAYRRHDRRQREEL